MKDQALKNWKNNNYVSSGAGGSGTTDSRLWVRVKYTEAIEAEMAIATLHVHFGSGAHALYSKLMMPFVNALKC